MHPNITEYWNKEFKMFFDPETGVDIDGLWIDMNEPTNASKKIKIKNTRAKDISLQIIGGL